MTLSLITLDISCQGESYDTCVLVASLPHLGDVLGFLPGTEYDHGWSVFPLESSTV